MSNIDVIKRDGTVESFDIDKLSDSIMSAALAVGGEDYELADEIAGEVEDTIEQNDIDEISAEDIQIIVEKTLIEDGHAATAKEYILKAADRNRMREMDSALMKSFEEITFKSEADSEVKRENANIDSTTAMGTMLKYGSEAAKSFNLLYMMSEDVAEAHRNCDIHIHDLDFLALTETCIDKDTLLTVKINNEIKVMTAEQLATYCSLGPVDIWKNVQDIQVLSNGKFVNVKAMVKHKSNDKHMILITTPTGKLRVTDEHTVSIIENGKTVDKKVKDIKVGDILSVPEIDTDRYTMDTLDIIKEYNGDNLVISNTDEVIRNIKNSNNWKQFCDIFDYRDTRAMLIRSNRTKMTVAEFKRVEHLCTLKHSELQLNYVRSRGKETINAVIPLTFELGNVIGLMYAEGSVTEHVDDRQASTVKKACFCNYDESLIEQFNKNYSTVFNNAKITDRKHDGKHTGSILSGYLQYELFHGVFGYKSSTADIRLAQWMFGANKEFVSGLLAGIIDGDGCVQRDGYRVSICSVSKVFLEDIQKLLLLRGIKSSIKDTNAVGGTVATFLNDGVEVESVRNYNNYKLEITGDLCNKVGWINSNKINSVDLKESNKFPYKYNTITDMHEVEYSDLVYDLETEDSHFTADGFNVHNCMQIPLDRLFKGGFNTGHGYLREPGSIRTAAALAAIAIQSDQNDQHGGQSIPMLDYYLAPYVALTYAKVIAHVAKVKLDLEKDQEKSLKRILVAYQQANKSIMGDDKKPEIIEILKKWFEREELRVGKKKIEKILSDAYDDTYDETFQAMEAFIHNLNTMHSRAGAQVPFSSVNYGTDTSVEGRMVMETILKTTWDGLGNGETPIFPIQILKLKNGINMNPGEPNYDIFCLACKVSAKRLYPNFVNCDAPYNAELYVPGHPETEIATMGCVESSEILHYTIDDTEYIETFEEAYRRIAYRCNQCDSNKYSNNSEYIDVSGIDVKVKDSVHGFVKVKKFIKNKNVNNFNVIKFSDGYSLTATSDHPLPVIGKGRTFVKDLKIGDKVEASRNDIVNCDYDFTTEYFKDNTYLLGVILADASYTSQICISLGLDEKDIVDYIDSIVSNLGYKLNVKEQHRGDKGDYFDCCIRGIKGLRYAETELASIFNGYKKEHRSIPSSLLTAARKYRLAFLAGLMDADGHVTCSSSRDGETERSARFSIGSTNKALAMTELALIRGLGYKAKMYRNKYSSRHSKIRYLIEFEITDELVAEMHCQKKIDKANTVDRCEFSDVDTIEVVSITSGCEENEVDGISYDLETESDMLDISYISSHNCRTRVGINKHDPDKSVIPGRGNLSFTSINLPRLGILAQGDINKFYRLLDSKLELVHKQLLERFEIQCQKHPINYPFLMGQGIWLGSDQLGPNDDIREILKHGTLAVGFIGLAETLVALIGKHHGESEEAQKLGLQIVQHMRDYTDAWSEEEHMNYSVIGTPAEGLSGRFVRADKQLFGTIPGVTDKDYYTNSSHVPVSYPISAFKKVEIEAPYHSIENGGHILYIEMDGDPTKNLKAFKKVVKYMHDKNAGYFAINHPVDRDPVCGYVGIIGDVCPRCGRREGEPMTMEMWNKIKGYANAGNADVCGACGNPDEEADRVINPLMDVSDMKFERGIK